jgi:hypothetical protein
MLSEADVDNNGKISREDFKYLMEVRDRGGARRSATTTSLLTYPFTPFNYPLTPQTRHKNIEKNLKKE